MADQQQPALPPPAATKQEQAPSTQTTSEESPAADELVKKDKYIQRLKEENAIRVRSMETNIRMLSDQNERLTVQMKQLKNSLNPENLLPAFMRSKPNAPPPAPPGPPPLRKMPSAKNHKSFSVVPLDESRKVKQLTEEKDLLKKDFDRLLEQLAKKEQESGVFQDKAENFEAQLSMNKIALMNAQKELTATRKDAERRDKELKKAREDEARRKATQASQSQELVHKYTEEVVVLREQLSLANLEKNTLKDELGEIKGTIGAADKRAADAEEALEEFKHQYGALEVSASMQEATFLEKQNAHAEQTKSWEKERASLHSQIEKLDLRVRKAEDSLEQHRRELKNIQREVDEQREMTDAARRQRDSVKTDLSRKLDEAVQNQKITDKKRNQLVKELKTQLKKEALAMQQLKAEHNKLQDEVVDLQQSTLGSSHPSRQLTPDPHSAASSVQGTSTPKFPFPPRRAAPSRPAPSRPPAGLRRSPSNASDGGSAEHEVAAALAKKVHEQEEKNFALKQQVKYLEQSVASLHEDLEKKKTTLRNILLRVDKTAALSTSQGPEKNPRSVEELKELLSKMEIFVQETSLQNAHLRRDLDAMGKEVQRLFKENQQLKKSTEL